jgi:site-specific recombinase XerC
LLVRVPLHRRFRMSVWWSANRMRRRSPVVSVNVLILPPWPTSRAGRPRPVADESGSHRSAQGLVKEVVDRAALTKDVTMHVFGHTFAATAQSKGISLATVQEILGHDRLQTTAFYLNFTDTHIQVEFERKW